MADWHTVKVLDFSLVTAYLLADGFALEIFAGRSGLFGLTGIAWDNGLWRLFLLCSLSFFAHLPNVDRWNWRSFVLCLGWYGGH
jgi:hypothetical protein